jgi:predicted thioredoxin/glutaredoxin
MKLFNFFKIIPLFIIICVLGISCGSNEGGNMENKISKGIEFLGRSDCIHSPKMEKNLVSALENSGLEKKYKYIDLASLPAEDYRRGYGTPTVLINGEDLYGMSKPKPIASAPT